LGRKGLTPVEWQVNYRGKGECGMFSRKKKGIFSNCTEKPAGRNGRKKNTEDQQKMHDRYLKGGKGMDLSLQKSQEKKGRKKKGCHPQVDVCRGTGREVPQKRWQGLRHFIAQEKKSTVKKPKQILPTRKKKKIHDLILGRGNRNKGELRTEGGKKKAF